MRFADLPALHAPLEGGGTFKGLVTTPDGVHQAIAFLGMSDEDMTHDQAVAWAAEHGGLPVAPRPAMATLFANDKASFDGNACWTGEVYEHDGSYAWFQHFLNGNQSFYGRSAKLRAVAVRLIPLTT